MINCDNIVTKYIDNLSDDSIYLAEVKYFTLSYEKGGMTQTNKSFVMNDYISLGKKLNISKKCYPHT